MDDPGLSSEEMVTLFGPLGRVRAYLEVEAVMAEAQAELGVIPKDAARAVAAACRDLEFDAAAVLAQGWEHGTPLIPLLDLVGSELAEHRQHLHRDTTTQDIVDTALVWRATQGIRVLIRDLLDTGGRLADLAERHRHAWMTGRSFLQAARPTTFGARAALWLDAVAARIEDLEVARSRLQVQLGGAVGLGTGMAGKTREVASLMGDQLGLASGDLPWQSDREPIVSLGTTVAGAARTGAKIAGDLIVLAQTEVGEVTMRPGGSTAMSHKANPVDAMRALAAAQLATVSAAGLLSASPPRLERDTGGWQVEWRFIAATFDATAVSVHAVNRALATVRVDEARMKSNLDAALTGDRPDVAEIDHLVDTAVSRFEKKQSELVSGSE